MLDAEAAVRVPRTPVESSNLRSVGYDYQAETLVVEFLGGQLYAYGHVGRESYDALMAADSKGRYFWTHIRDLHPHVHLTPPKPES